LPQQVKIVTGWSNPGGSTTCIINLAKKLIDSGYDVEVFGPHDWHIHELARQGYNVGFGSKYFSCKEDDIVISHFSMLGPIKAKKKIYWCHEMSNFMNLTDDMMEPYDKVVFVSETQKKTHSLKSDRSIVIPNFIEEFPKMKHERACGIIGSIDTNKQTHMSIQKALHDGEKKIYLFGNVTDKVYYDNFVKHYVDSGFVSPPMYEADKVKMYSMIDKVYHSALYESFGLVKAECYALGIDYMGTVGEDECSYKTNDEVFELWKEILK